MDGDYREVIWWELWVLPQDGNMGDMKTDIIKVSENCVSSGDEECLMRAGEILRKGGLVAFPTETVYGLGGDAPNPEASVKIYTAKGRPSDNPLIIHINKFADIYQIVKEMPEAAVKVGKAFWPGPLTMILPKAEKVPYETTGGLNTVAVRFPSHPIARKLIEYGGGFVAAPSANASGKPSPTRAKHVVEDMDGRIEMIVDGGEVGIGLESTIIDMTVEPPRILRPGYITQEMLKQVLGEVGEDVTMMRNDSGEAPRAPGMKYRHYAPSGSLVIVEGEPQQVADYINARAAQDSKAGERTGILGTREQLEQYHADVIKCIGSREEEEAVARNLFAVLREFDEEKVTKIYSESFPAQGLGQAVMNRLLKAAGYCVVKV